MEDTGYGYLTTSCKEIVSNNKQHIKLMIDGATVFLLFLLHIDSRPFKIIKKLYLAHSAVLLVMQTLTLLVIILFFTIYQ